MAVKKQLLVGIPATLVLLLEGLFWFVFFSPRPPLATEAETLAGDGSLINYCELPALDGSGRLAAEIPQGKHAGLRLFPFSPADSRCLHRTAGSGRG